MLYNFNIYLPYSIYPTNDSAAKGVLFQAANIKNHLLNPEQPYSHLSGRVDQGWLHSVRYRPALVLHDEISWGIVGGLRIAAPHLLK